MELNPEDVKAELAAVQIACDQVNARLDRSRGKAAGARPHILSRVSKAVNPSTANQQQPVRSYAEYDRRSSRRFVNRDWNIARKRTAEGLFVDDQEEGEDQDDQDQGPPRKRSNADDQSLQAGSRQAGAALHSVRPDNRAPYNPYNEAKQPVISTTQTPHNDAVLRRRQEDPGTATIRRGFDKSRISFSSGAQQQENGQPGTTRRFVRGHDTRAVVHEQPSLSQRRRLHVDHHAEGMRPDLDERPDTDGPVGQMEEGEVDTQPSAPPPAEEFVVAKRPERPATVPDKVQQRNRRMFGALLGHLDGAERQEKKFEQSSVLKRRKELEQHAAERARLDSIQARQAERSRIFEARRKDIAAKRELLLQQNMKKAKLLCAERIAYARGLLRFIRTETIPPILWEPAGINRDVEQLFEQQSGDFESWAEEQLDKLRLDQQGMRERAEKQWATIDRIRQERYNANLGRWKSATGPAKSAPKAVRSSVMTARDYRDRAQRTQQTDVTQADEPDQPGNEDDQDNAAADDAEAHDDAYLVAEADRAAADGTGAQADNPPQSNQTADMERHAGVDEAAASGDDENKGPQVQEGPQADQRHSGDSPGSGDEDAGPTKVGDADGHVHDEAQHSDDSLSLSE
eukprot:jgi/Ulvmu1/10002/UM059_0051.1